MQTTAIKSYTFITDVSEEEILKLKVEFQELYTVLVKQKINPASFGTIWKLRDNFQTAQREADEGIKY